MSEKWKVESGQWSIVYGLRGKRKDERRVIQPDKI